MHGFREMRGNYAEWCGIQTFSVFIANFINKTSCVGGLYLLKPWYLRVLRELQYTFVILSCNSSQFEKKYKLKLYCFVLTIFIPGTLSLIYVFIFDFNLNIGIFRAKCMCFCILKLTKWQI